jgi:hypothetical protein
VNRGGSWNNTAANVRSANRNNNTPSNRNNNLGFRLLRPQLAGAAAPPNRMEPWRLFAVPVLHVQGKPFPKLRAPGFRLSLYRTVHTAWSRAFLYPSIVLACRSDLPRENGLSLFGDPRGHQAFLM